LQSTLCHSAGGALKQLQQFEGDRIGGLWCNRQATPVLGAIIELCDCVGEKVMTSSRLPLLAVAVFAAVAYTSAQRSGTPDLEQLSSADAFALTPQWLLTGDPRARAWASYWIGRDREEPEIPLLLDALENYGSAALGSSHWSDDDSALLVALDTLIQRKADVSSDLAGALYAKVPAHTLILLAYSQEDARAALLTIIKIADGLAGGCGYARREPAPWFRRQTPECHLDSRDH
jgi:hypothetical protein